MSCVYMFDVDAQTLIIVERLQVKNKHLSRPPRTGGRVLSRSLSRPYATVHLLSILSVVLDLEVFNLPHASAFCTPAVLF